MKTRSARTKVALIAYALSATPAFAAGPVTTPVRPATSAKAAPRAQAPQRASPRPALPAKTAAAPTTPPPKASPQPASPPTALHSYVVQTEVTFDEVSVRLYGTPAMAPRIAGANHTTTADTLTPGRKLALDSAAKLDARQGEQALLAYRRERLAAKNPDMKPSHLNVGLGTTVIAYAETGKSDYSSISMTAKASYLRSIGQSNWDFGFSGYGTVIPVTKNLDATARFFGLNARIGYAFPWPRSPWRFSLLAGAYYTTMLVSQSQFGFRNAAGPQLYPTLRVALGKRQSLAAYFKFSPVTDGLKLLDLSNREIATGLIYSRALGNGHPISVSVDAAALYLNLSGIIIRSNTVNVGLGYGF